MEIDLLGLAVLALIVAAVAWAVSQVSGRGRGVDMQRAAIESEAVGHYYQQALKMARILDRLERDDMIAVTIPADLRQEIRTVVETFFEGGDGKRPLYP